jgi:hypothetical protein
VDQQDACEMIRYFKLQDDLTIPHRWHLGWASLADDSEPRLRVGLRFDSSEVPKIPVNHAGRALDFSLTSFGVPVATKALSDVVRVAAGSDVQCVPVEIAGQVCMVVLNSVRVVRCLDEKASEFIKWAKQDHRADLAGQYRQITRLVLDTAMIPADARFFRMEGWPVQLVVSADVKEAMEAVGCFGAKFIELPTTGPGSSK